MAAGGARRQRGDVRHGGLARRFAADDAQLRHERGVRHGRRRPDLAHDPPQDARQLHAMLPGVSSHDRGPHLRRPRRGERGPRERRRRHKLAAALEGAAPVARPGRAVVRGPGLPGESAGRRQRRGVLDAGRRRDLATVRRYPRQGGRRHGEPPRQVICLAGRFRELHRHQRRHLPQPGTLQGLRAVRRRAAQRRHHQLLRRIERADTPALCHGRVLLG